MGFMSFFLYMCFNSVLVKFIYSSTSALRIPPPQLYSQLIDPSNIEPPSSKQWISYLALILQAARNVKVRTDSNSS